MHRLFVAIRPPAPIRQLLLGAMGGIGGARWQSDDQIHLTLRFIGEVDRNVARDIDAALTAIRQPGFEIALGGAGTFERRGRPDVVWTGAAPHEPLKALHKKIDQAIVRAGLEPERRAFHPHVTLARLNRASGPVIEFLAATGGLKTPAFAIDGFELCESRLTPEGAAYSTLERYALG